MSAVVFLGPSLNRNITDRLCHADIRPPAAMGDVTRAASGNPAAIVLIDGVFEDRPSVWHKEILWSLSRGVPVIGASSMGALRAAELDQQGMLGAGEVYEAYASGAICDDDEVAVVHGPAETGYMALSDAMIDIRDAVSQAKFEGVITPGESEAVIEAAKRRHFKNRHLGDTVHGVLRTSRTAAELASVLHWFAAPRQGLKSRDAAFVLRHLGSLIAEAKVRALQAPPFMATVYLHRLEPFGYRHP